MDGGEKWRYLIEKKNISSNTYYKQQNSNSQFQSL
jgi:hypothetical protein